MRISAGRRFRKPERAAGFRTLNGVNTFYVEVTSACEKRQRCTINAYVVGSRGGKAGQGAITLPPGSLGQEAKKTWSMRIAENGGMANMSWRCKDIQAIFDSDPASDVRNGSDPRAFGWHA